MANLVAEIIYAKPPGKFKTPDEAFNFGFDQFVAEHGGRENFLWFDGPKRLAQSVKKTKGPGRKAEEGKNLPASIAVQMAEVKSKVRRTFDRIYIPRK